MYNLFKEVIKGFNSEKFFPIIAVGIFFAFFFLFAHPAYYSDDDIYFLYALSGGYGVAPTHLLHYSFSWHPVLSWPVLHLFKLAPWINWYSICLLSLHLAACIYLFHLLQMLFSGKPALLIFLVFFLFIEGRLLLSLSYSGTSFLLCQSGLTGLLILFKKEKRQLYRRHRILAILLLMAGALMRPHMAALCTFLAFSTGIFLLPFSSYKAMLRTLVLPGLLLILAISGQQYFYRQAIPGWNDQNHFRESYFHLSNHPIKPPKPVDSSDLVTQSLIQGSFIYDTSFVSQQNLDDFAKKAITRRFGLDANTLNGIYWTFMESRVYLLLWVVLLTGIIITQDVYETLKWLYQCLPALLIFCYLYIFLKLTEAIFLALFSSVFFSAVLAGRNFLIKNQVLKYLFFFLLLFCCSWMVKRLDNINTRNQYHIKLARQAINELNAHKNLLFISSDNQFPLNLSIWDAPVDYPLHNFLNKELALTFTHKELLHRKGITDIVIALPVRKDVVLIGKEIPLLKEYYNLNLNWKIDILKKAQLLDLDIYQIKVDSGKN